MEVTRRGEAVNLTALAQVWGPQYVDEVDYVKLYIWRIRQKIEDDPSNPQYILTERGLGYRFMPASRHSEVN